MTMLYRGPFRRTEIRLGKCGSPSLVHYTQNYLLLNFLILVGIDTWTYRRTSSG